MGSEDLFRKRKSRDQATLQRHRGVRAQSKRYLIVCEGTKTEPYYLQELLDDLRIRSQRIRVAPNDGVTPDRVVAHALKLYDEDASLGDAYDQVYCVFDRDTHPSFDAAVQRTASLKAKGKPFVAITSTPCFEIWLLLHFRYSDKPVVQAGNKSAGQQVLATLKKIQGLSNYGKGDRGVYAKLKARLPNALQHAKRLREASAATGSPNPSTDFDVLVGAIQKLATN